MLWGWWGGGGENYIKKRVKGLLIPSFRAPTLNIIRPAASSIFGRRGKKLISKSRGNNQVHNIHIPLYLGINADLQ